MIFRAFKIYRMGKQGIKDPAGFVADEAGGFVLGAFLLPLILTIAFIIFLGALAFSSFLGGPYLIAKILFFLILIPYLGALSLILFLRKVAQNVSHTVVNKGRETLHVKATEVAEPVVESCYGVILARKNFAGDFDFLLITQLPDGHTGFPKGHADPGESDIDAAMRELREETSITKVNVVQKEMLRTSYEFTQNNVVHQKTVYFLLATSVEGFDVPSIPKEFEHEISKVGWYSYEDAKSALTYEKTRELLKEAYVLLKS